MGEDDFSSLIDFKTGNTICSSVEDFMTPDNIDIGDGYFHFGETIWKLDETKSAKKLISFESFLTSTSSPYNIILLKAASKCFAYLPEFHHRITLSSELHGSEDDQYEIFSRGFLSFSKNRLNVMYFL